MSDVIILESFPFPPSVNESYKVAKFGFKAGLRGSDVLNRFKQDVQFYKQKHLVDLLKAHAKVQGWLDDGFVVSSRIYLLWPYEDVFTKTKRAKSKFHRLDGNNRIKAVTDAVADCLDIDDSYFFDEATVKMVQMERMPKCAIITLSKTKPMSAQDLMKLHPLLTKVAFSAST